MHPEKKYRRCKNPWNFHGAESITKIASEKLDRILTAESPNRMVAVAGPVVDVNVGFPAVLKENVDKESAQRLKRTVKRQLIVLRNLITSVVKGF